MNDGVLPERRKGWTLSEVKMLRCMPILQVTDVRRSVLFYREKLGFFAHRLWGDGPDFCIVQYDRVTIALDRCRDGQDVPTNQYWAAYVYVDDADALYATYKEAGVEIVRDPEDMPYGLRDFDVRDPDGHVIAFGHDLEIGATDPGLATAPSESP